MSKDLTVAPLLPGGSIDFNALHDLARKGDADAIIKATICAATDPETPAAELTAATAE